MPERVKALTDWLGEVVGLGQFTLQPASDDASFRRYFRLTLGDGSRRIAMDAPPPREDCRPFVQRARQLAALGLHVPEIHAVDLQQGFILLEDLGTVHYLDRLDGATADRLYGDALAALAVMQSVGPRQGLPYYDRNLLAQEMALFPDWLLGRHLGLDLQPLEREMLETTFALLIENALEQPQVWVHRDYHSRNLLVSSSPTPGIIDFQDAVLGPVTYDLVSLLKDCYIAWPLARVHDWALGYYQLAVQSGVPMPADESRFLRWFDLMGVQRHLKASGIFARLCHRDGKRGYLDDIPRTLGYIVETGARYPELSGLARLIERRLLPVL